MPRTSSLGTLLLAGALITSILGTGACTIGGGGGGFGFIGQNADDGGPGQQGGPGVDATPGSDLARPGDTNTADPCARVRCSELEVCEPLQDTTVCVCAPGTERRDEACVLASRRATLVHDWNTAPASSNPEITPTASGEALAWMTTHEHGRALYALDAEDGATLLWAPSGGAARGANPHTTLTRRGAGWVFTHASTSRGESHGTIGYTTGAGEGQTRVLAQREDWQGVSSDSAEFEQLLVLIAGGGTPFTEIDAATLEGTQFTGASVLGRTGESSIIVTREGSNAYALWRVPGVGAPQKLTRLCRRPDAAMLASTSECRRARPSSAETYSTARWRSSSDSGSSSSRAASMRRLASARSSIMMRSGQVGSLGA